MKKLIEEILTLFLEADYIIEDNRVIAYTNPDDIRYNLHRLLQSYLSTNPDLAELFLRVE